MIKQLAIQVAVLFSLMSLPQSIRHRVEFTESMEDQQKNSSNTRYARMDNLRLGNKGGPLIPALVVPKGARYEFSNKEKRSFLSRNDYTWILKKRCSGNMCQENEEKLMQAKGGWLSNVFGHRQVKVRDQNGNRLFDFRMNRYRWNPFQMRSVFRVFPPDVRDKDQTLFTINRDIFGKGFLWMRWEWRVYQGRKREKKPLYYVLEKYSSALGRWYTQTGDYKIYKSQEDQEAKKKPVAILSKKLSVKGVLGDAFGAGDLLPDKYKIKVEEGEDSGILLVLSSIIDMISDLVSSGNAASSALDD